MYKKINKNPRDTINSWHIIVNKEKQTCYFNLSITYQIWYTFGRVYPYYFFSWKKQLFASGHIWTLWTKLLF